MSGELDAVAGLLRGQKEAALATLEGGRPFASAAGYLVEDEKDPTLVFLFSDLSRHTRNLRNNPALSVLVVEENPEAPIHEKMRATLIGEAEPVQAREDFERLKQAYLKKFPRSEIFFSLPDFRFYRLRAREIHWIGGFGRAKTLVLKEGAWI